MFLSGLYADAITEYTQIAEQNSTDHRIFFRLGKAYQHSSKFEEALASFIKSNQLSESFEATLQIGICNKILGKDEEAQKYFILCEKLASTKSKKLSYYIYMLDSATLDRKWEEGLSFTEKILEIEPNNKIAHENYGTMLIGCHRTDQGFKAFEKAALLFPNNWRILGRWGAWYRDLGITYPSEEFHQILSAQASVERFQSAIENGEHNADPEFFFCWTNIFRSLNIPEYAKKCYQILISQKGNKTLLQFSTQEEYAHYLRELGEIPEAVLQYQSLINNMDVIPFENIRYRIYLFYGVCLHTQAKHKEAIEFLLQAEKYNQDGFLYSVLGSCYYTLRNKTAVFYLEKVCSFDPNSSAPISILGKAVLDLGETSEDDERAIELFKQALKLNPNDYIALSHYGIALMNLEKYDEAEEKLRQAIKLNPFDPLSYQQLGVILKVQGKFDQALLMLDKALSVPSESRIQPAYSPDLKLIYGNKADILSHLQRYEEAIEVFEKALTLTPNNPYLLTNWGFALSMINQNEEAVKKFSRAYEISPKSAEVCWRFAAALLVVQNYEEAEKKYLEAVQAAESDPIVLPQRDRLYHDVARFYLDVKQPETAQIYLQQAAEFNPQNDQIFVLWGLCLWGPDLQRSIEKFKMAMQANPQNPEAHFHIAYAYLALQSPEFYSEAENHLQMAVEIDPQYAQAWGLLGQMSYLKQEPVEKALIFFQKSSNIQKTPWTVANEALCLYADYKWTEALEKLEQVPSLNPSLAADISHILNLHLQLDNAGVQEALVVLCDKLWDTFFSNEVINNEKGEDAS